MPIYIVDDNQDMSEFLAFVLSNEGNTVHAFTCPEEALGHMQAEHVQPAILITDYNMPKMNGYELHEQVCLHAPAVKTIVISGRCVKNLIGELQFVQKPFPPERIIQLVEAIKEDR